MIAPIPVGAFGLALGLWLFAGMARSAERRPSAPAPDTGTMRLLDALTVDRLEDGLTLIVLPRPGTGMVAAELLVRVGAADGDSAESGLAHMFEHMAFKGSRELGSRDLKAEGLALDAVTEAGIRLTEALDAGDSSLVAALKDTLARRIEWAESWSAPGAFVEALEGVAIDYNATTSRDFTAYTAEFPSSNLDEWLRLVGRSFCQPSYRGFYAELEVVRDERRIRTDTKPLERATEILYQTAFEAHPYARPPLGSTRDLGRLNPMMAERFHARYYRSEATCCVLVGDVTRRGARSSVEKAFACLPTGPRPPYGPGLPPASPEAGTATTLRAGRERAVLFGFRLPTDDPIPRPVLDVLAQLLGGGSRSLLRGRLVDEARLARRVIATSGTAQKRFPGLFQITVVCADSVTTDAVRRETLDFLGRLGADCDSSRISDTRDVQLVKTLRLLEQPADLAAGLARGWGADNDPAEPGEYVRELTRLRQSDVTGAAARLFTLRQAFTVFVEPDTP